MKNTVLTIAVHMFLSLLFMSFIITLYLFSDKSLRNMTDFCSPGKNRLVCS